MEVDFFSVDGLRQGRRSFDLPDVDVREASGMLRAVLLAYRNNFRQGDASTKSRAEVSGSGKKPYRQKGTGMARCGEKRSPIWRGGGVVFGPSRRSYEVKVNVKMRRKALNASLLAGAGDGNLVLVEGFPTFSVPKTKDAVAWLNNFDVASERTILLVDSDFSRSLALSLRNVRNVYMVEANTLNAMDVAAGSKMLISERALEILRSRVSGMKNRGSQP